ncbi:hypothetical protein [Paracoccus alkanivorans]|uniref:Uncharacterized protein n=1 Tax=Paracoccus alkanivorans TaxID=2116655 RepID=A0A3M0MDK1_9RHOB|nr:hypothetical protein [Paracoccus alkanivorans]RMC35711.1 hypothetical protein C9E81_10925 [Paracoccus alkanivorans]
MNFARMAAFSAGVSKSGSPKPGSITSLPASRKVPAVRPIAAGAEGRTEPSKLVVHLITSCPHVPGQRNRSTRQNTCIGTARNKAEPLLMDQAADKV